MGWTPTAVNSRTRRRCGGKRWGTATPSRNHGGTPRASAIGRYMDPSFEKRKKLTSLVAYLLFTHLEKICTLFVFVRFGREGCGGNGGWSAGRVWACE